jgi:hypothetical protein
MSRVTYVVRVSDWPQSLGLRLKKRFLIFLMIELHAVLVSDISFIELLMGTEAGT